MGKDSHFTGQPVYSQVLKLLDKDKIRQISHDRRAASLTSNVLAGMNI